MKTSSTRMVENIVDVDIVSFISHGLRLFYLITSFLAEISEVLVSFSEARRRTFLYGYTAIIFSDILVSTKRIGQGERQKREEKLGNKKLGNIVDVDIVSFISHGLRLFYLITSFLAEISEVLVSFSEARRRTFLYGYTAIIFSDILVSTKRIGQGERQKREEKLGNKKLVK